MRVKCAYYPKTIDALVIEMEDGSVYSATLGFRPLKESDLTRLHAFDNAAYRKAALKPEDEIFPFCYFQYGLEKAGVEMGRLLKLADYAAKIGRDPANVRQKILRGGLPSAVKMGRDWFIPADAPYDDNRVTSGKYIDVKRNR